ncbi:DUF2971 domain-containing protein [Pedobacter gandavensis]|uniref:DUF2971 domain-containing protein n=1 Tax=Pedobacter gandavensis TaxID=2679963 RepID=UPI002930CE6B|nr:DUF2971 domain-containing protein [Pedobacter gandavensis]
MIENNSLWGCSAVNLNDPYDCDFEITKTFIKNNYFNQITVLDYPEGNISTEKLDLAKEITLVFLKNKLLQALQDQYRTNLGVCCFTTDPLSELMWSHYANSAKGVCLEFSFRSSLEISNKIIPVHYSNKRILVETEINRAKALFQKQIAWSYEKEWRILANQGYITFNKSNLIGVIFGPRTPVAEVKLVKDLFDKHHYQVKFYFCDYSPNGLKKTILTDEILNEMIAKHL